MDLLIFYIIIFCVIWFIGKIADEIFGSKSSPPERTKAVKSSVPKNYTENPSANFLQSCIDRNKIISFTYIDNDGVITERSVTPKRIFWGYSNREGGDKKIRTCWLESYCHMRKEDRTFIKDRMSKVSIN